MLKRVPTPIGRESARHSRTAGSINGAVSGELTAANTSDGGLGGAVVRSIVDRQGSFMPGRNEVLACADDLAPRRKVRPPTTDRRARCPQGSNSLNIRRRPMSASLVSSWRARLLADGAGIHAGDVVLDLACGIGLVARHAVALVSPNGRLVGADINPAMLEIARGSIDDGVEWVESPSDDLPFDDNTCPHVICQQGFQFFPDPVAAMRETVRVLRPGRLLIATVWATPGHNPYIENQLDSPSSTHPSRHRCSEQRRLTPTISCVPPPRRRGSPTSRSRCSNTMSTSPTSNPGSSPKPEGRRGARPCRADRSRTT